MRFARYISCALIFLSPLFAQDRQTKYVMDVLGAKNPKYIVDMPYDYKTLHDFENYIDSELYALPSVVMGTAKIKYDGNRYYIDGQVDTTSARQRLLLQKILKKADIYPDCVITKFEVDSLKKAIFLNGIEFVE